MKPTPESSTNDLIDLILSSIPPGTGKRIGESLWVHASAVDAGALDALRRMIENEHPVPLDDLVIRVDQRRRRIAHLHYPRFFDDAHPALCCSALFDRASGTVAIRSFAARLNRPILHRKELLVARSHAAYNGFAALTADEDRRGLLDDKRRIGWSAYWNQLLQDRGVTVEGHRIRELRSDD